MGDRDDKHLNHFIVYGINHPVVSDTVAVVAFIVSLKSFDIGIETGGLLELL